MATVIAIVWRYDVLEDHRSSFERTYAPSGAWAELFARAEGYFRTELMRGPEDGSYVTLDFWSSEIAFERFLTAHRADYEALDRSTEGWTSKEERLGIFEVIA